MKNALWLDANDIKKILAEKYNVPESNVVKYQYSYTVVIDDNENDKINLQNS